MTETKRAVNFSAKEEGLLVALVGKYRDVIENKQTDNNMNRQKNECWQKIEKEFNNQSGAVYRNNQTLKKKYENLKKRTKKRIADEKCYSLGTGGGPAIKIPPIIDDIDSEIKDILGSERTEGLPTKFGGDSDFNEIITIIEVNEGQSGDDNIDPNGNLQLDPTEGPSNVSETQDLGKVVCEPSTSKNGNKLTDITWSQNSVQNLRTPKSSPLLTTGKSFKRKRDEYGVLCNKVSQWAEAKSGIETDKKKYMEEEHKLKIKWIEDKFKKEIEVMEKEHESRIKIKELETELVLDGLREQNKIKKEILLLEKHALIKKIQDSSRNVI